MGGRTHERHKEGTVGERYKRSTRARLRHADHMATEHTTSEAAYASLAEEIIRDAKKSFESPWEKVRVCGGDGGQLCDDRRRCAQVCTERGVTVYRRPGETPGFSVMRGEMLFDGGITLTDVVSVRFLFFCVSVSRYPR